MINIYEFLSHIEINLFDEIRISKQWMSYVVFTVEVHLCSLPIIWSSRSRSGRTIFVNVDSFHCDVCCGIGSSEVVSIFSFILVWKMDCSIIGKVLSYTIRIEKDSTEETEWDGEEKNSSNKDVNCIRELHIHNRNEKSPLIIIPFFSHCCHRLLMRGNEYGCKRNQ